MKNYLEIINRKDWKDKYKSKVEDNIDWDNYYKHTEPLLKKLFSFLNKGEYQPTLVFDYTGEIEEDFNNYDKRAQVLLMDGGYEYIYSAWKAGYVLKDGKKKKIVDVLSSLKSKKIEQLQKASENSNAAKKQLKMIQRIIMNSDDTKEYIDSLMKNMSIIKNRKHDKYKIVLTMDHRAIGSQSTHVGWTSCMNLDTGAFKENVGSGIEAGVIIAYLTKVGDEYELENPIGRVLLKPFSSRSGDVIWKTDAIYGSPPSSFKKNVETIIDEWNNDQPRGKYTIEGGVYEDEVDNDYIHNEESLDALLDDIFDNDNFDKIDKLNIEELDYLISHFPLYKKDIDKDVLIKIFSRAQHFKMKREMITLFRYTNYYLPTINLEQIFLNIKDDMSELQLKELISIYPSGILLLPKKEQTVNLIKEALLRKKDLYKYFKNDKNVIQKVLMANPRLLPEINISDFDMDFWEKFFNLYPRYLSEIPKEEITYKMLRGALAKDYDALKYVDKMTPELWSIALKNNSAYMVSLTADQLNIAVPEDVQMKMIDMDAQTIYNLRSQMPIKVIEFVVQRYPSTIEEFSAEQLKKINPNILNKVKLSDREKIQRFSKIMTINQLKDAILKNPYVINDIINFSEQPKNVIDMLKKYHYIHYPNVRIWEDEDIPEEKEIEFDIPEEGGGGGEEEE